jgi:hypothetical protein
LRKFFNSLSDSSGAPGNYCHSDLAAVVEQALTDVFETACGPKRIHGVEALDLDRAPTAPAFHPEPFARDFRQPHLLGSHGRPAARGSRRGASQYSWSKAPSGGGRRFWGVRSGSDASFSICFAVGIRHDTSGRSCPMNRTQREQGKSRCFRE